MTPELSSGLTAVDVRWWMGQPPIRSSLRAAELERHSRAKVKRFQEVRVIHIFVYDSEISAYCLEQADQLVISQGFTGR